MSMVSSERPVDCRAVLGCDMRLLVYESMCIDENVDQQWCARDDGVNGIRDVSDNVNECFARVYEKVCRDKWRRFDIQYKLESWFGQLDACGESR